LSFDHFNKQQLYLINSPDGSGILVAAGIYAATRYSGQQEPLFPENALASAPKISKNNKARLSEV
jgi:hypothetical protein